MNNKNTSSAPNQKINMAAGCVSIIKQVAVTLQHQQQGVSQLGGGGIHIHIHIHISTPFIPGTADTPVSSVSPRWVSSF